MLQENAWNTPNIHELLTGFQVRFPKGLKTVTITREVSGWNQFRIRTRKSHAWNRKEHFKRATLHLGIDDRYIHDAYMLRRVCQ
ncbi:Muscle-specific protein [Dirofilaria immitis]